MQAQHARHGVLRVMRSWVKTMHARIREEACSVAVVVVSVHSSKVCLGKALSRSWCAMATQPFPMKVLHPFDSIG